MSKIKKIVLWSVLLNKRFLRKPLLLVLLCLIPLTALLAKRLPEGSGSLLTVGVCPGNEEDSLASLVIDRLVREKSSGAVRYIRYDTEDRLRAAVCKGDVRLGFLFPEDLSALMDAYAKITYSGSGGGALSMLGQALGIAQKEDVDVEGMKQNAIRVICGSNDIVTKLEKEHLFGNLYDEIEIYVLRSWMDLHASDMPVSKEKRDEFLDKAMAKSSAKSNFFRIADTDGNFMADQDMDRYYLSPMRGLLAVTLILICFAACLFLIQDNRKGLFVWIRPCLRPYFHYLYILIPVIDGGIFAYLALWLSGASGLPLAGGGTELLLWVLYLPAAAGFSNLVRVLTRRMTLFSATIPIVIMGCLLLTPVFLDIRILPPVQALFPTYFYLKALHQSSLTLPLLLYALITNAASIAIDAALNR